MRALLIALLLIATGYLLVRVNSFRSTSWEYLTPGAVDFGEYWAASKLLKNGENPYSGANMLRIQQGLSARADTPIMMWNPPWTFPIVAPFSSLPFSSAARIWALFSFGLLLVSLCLASRVIEAEYRVISLIGAAGVLGPAILTNLGFGQIGMVLGFAATGAIVCAVRSRWLLAGAFVALSTIKPHMTYLLSLYLAWYSLRLRKWDFFIGGTLTFAALFVSPLLANPDIYSIWIEAVANPDPIATSVKSWMVASLVGALRYLVNVVLNTDKTVFLSALIPGVATCMTLFWAIRHGVKSSLLRVCVTLTFLSVMFSPYGWPFDFVVLLLPVAYTLQNLLEHGSTKVLSGALIALSAALVCTYWLLSNPFTPLSIFFWYPPVLYAIWWSCHDREIKVEEEH